MPRKRDQVVSSLTRKGFRQDNGDHIFLIYVRQDGKTSSKRTKVSRGSGHNEISDNLLGQMARQIGLTRKQLEELVDCPMTRQAYENAAHLDLLHRNSGLWCCP